MATLDEIKRKLNIDTTNIVLNNGLHNPKKNKHCRIGDYIIISIKNDLYVVVDYCIQVVDLLTNYVWCLNSANYLFCCYVGYFHKQFLQYENFFVCDHKNRLKYDNRLCNLRVVRQLENMKNKTIRHTNTSGRQGIYNSNGKWIAQISDDGLIYKKSFSINKHGNDEAKNKALRQREQWEIQFNYIV